MTVEVRYVGHLGNNLFQYALGRRIAEALGQALLCVPTSPRPDFSRIEQRSGVADHLFGLADHFADAPQTLAGTAIEQPQLRFVLGEKLVWSGNGLNLPWLLEHGGGHRIVLRGYFQRAEYYLPVRDRVRRWLALKAASKLAPAPRDVFVHVRRSQDVFVLDRALAMSYYVEQLERMRPARVWVSGLGIGEVERAALAPFAPEYLELDAIETLAAMAASSRIIMANSTFSWWGAFASNAEEIVFPRPRRGFWGVERPDVALEIDEPPYRIVDDVPVSAWLPFRPARDCRIEYEAGDATSFGLVAGGSGRPAARVALPLPLAALGQWLATQREPFGPADLFPYLPRGVNPAAALALVAVLVRSGAVMAAEGSLDSLQTMYGDFGRFLESTGAER